MAEFFALTGISLRRLLFRARFFVALGLTAACVLYCYSRVPPFLAEQGMQIQAAEPFLMFFSSRITQLFLLLSFLLLAGDAPFCHDGMEYVVTRSGKRRWLLAQCVSMLVLTLIWLFWILLCTLAVFRRCLDFSGQWSLFTKLVGRNMGQFRLDSFGFQWQVHPSANLLSASGPYGMLALDLLLDLLLFGSVGIWCAALNLWTRRSYGCAFTVILWVLRFGLDLMPGLYALERFSPLSLIDLHAAPMTADRIAWILCFFLGQMLPLLVLCLRRIRRIDLTKLR